MSELEIWTLPEDMILPLIASYRTLEKSLNPVISFPMKCSKCGKMSDGQTQGPNFIKSKKLKNKMPIVIGIQCLTEGCDIVIKFERPISPGDESYPQRLKKYPSTALTSPDGKIGAKREEYMKQVSQLLDLDRA